MIRLWGRANSVNVQKVLWCLDELGLDYQRVDAGLEFGVVSTPEYRRLNPNGLVPTLEDGDLVLWESNAIVRYLAARYGSGALWPENPAQRALTDRWMDWQVATLWARLRPAFWGLVRTPPEKRDQAAIDDACRKTAESLAILDAALAGREFVAGPQLTIGDIALGPPVQRWMALPVARPPMPNLQAWFDRLSGREAFAQHVLKPLS